MRSLAHYTVTTYPDRYRIINNVYICIDNSTDIRTDMTVMTHHVRLWPYMRRLDFGRAHKKIQCSDNMIFKAAFLALDYAYFCNQITKVIRKRVCIEYENGKVTATIGR